MQAVEPPKVPGENTKRRRRINVNEDFQDQYFRICFWTGLAVIGVATMMFTATKLFVSVNQDFHPVILGVLVGIIVFIVLFCAAIGYITVRMTHKVTWASIKLERAIERILDGRLDEAVHVQKDQWLKNLSGALDGLRSDLVLQRKQIQALQVALQNIRDSIPASAGLAADQALEHTEVLLKPMGLARKSA